MNLFRYYIIIAVLLLSQGLMAQNIDAERWINADQLLIEQVLSLPEEGRDGMPLQAGMLQPADVDMCAGQWRIDEQNVENVTQWKFAAPGSGGLTVYYNDLFLAPGAELWMTNPSRTLVMGPYTPVSNAEGGAFATGILDDDSLVLELRRPIGDVDTRCMVSAVSLVKPQSNKGFGGSGACEVNINCTEGANWQKEKKGVVRIYVRSGSSTYWCTGSLINNTRNDHTPYLLTANHCGKDVSATDMAQWIFSLNYEANECPNPLLEPDRIDMTGADKIAQSAETANVGSDFLMVKLKQTIPVQSNVYFNGWSREITASSSGVGIHQPQGDIKKVSTYTSPLVSSNWNGSAAGTHWEVRWAETTNGHGVTEGGSSGSPLFDADGLILGALTGGQSGCTSLTQPDYYGRLSYSWNTNENTASQLAAWLDPDNTGVMKLGGLPLAVSSPAQQTEVALWPNPASGFCKVFIPEGVNGEKMAVMYTASGSVVLRSALDTGYNTISLDGIARGVYLIVIELNNGSFKPQRLIVY